MPRLTLKNAGDYIRTSRGSSELLSYIKAVKHIISFPKEHANRFSRYVIITRAYAAGQPIEDIQKRFGASRRTVLRYARLAELPKRPKHFPAEIRAAVISDYKDKMPVADIARLHDVSPAYVSKLAREEGISRYEQQPKKKKKA